METWNKSTVWFSAENHRAIIKSQIYDHYNFREKVEAMCDAILYNSANKDNPTLPYLIEYGFYYRQQRYFNPNFISFSKEAFDELCGILSPIVETIANCMIEISY